MNKQITVAGRFAILLSSSLTIMVGTVIAPSLIEISKNLNFNANPGWLITLPALGVVLFASLAGKLIDKKGAWVTMCIGLIPYGILGTLGFLLHHPWILTIDRILLGAATAAVQASATGLIYQHFHGRERIKMIAWQGMSIELGGVLYLSFGGYLAELGWALPFYIYLLSFLCLMLTIKYIPRLAVNKTQDVTRSKLSLNMRYIFALTILAMISFFAAIINLPLYLPLVFGFSAGQTGFFMAFISIIAVVTAASIPRSIQSMGMKFTLLTGFCCFFLGHLFLSLSGNIPILYAAAILLGIGFGFSIPLLNHMTLEESNDQNVGRNLGFYSAAIFGGQFLSSFLGLLSEEHQVIFGITGVIAFLTSLLLMFFPPKNT